MIGATPDQNATTSQGTTTSGGFVVVLGRNSTALSVAKGLFRIWWLHYTIHRVLGEEKLLLKKSLFLIFSILTSILVLYLKRVPSFSWNPID